MKKTIRLVMLILSLILYSACATNSTAPEKHLSQADVSENNTSKKSSLCTSIQNNVVTKFITDKVNVIKEVFTTPPIEGKYNLVQGQYVFKDKNLFMGDSIEASSIVIEKLSENDFGFYYVTKLKKHDAQGYFGGFTYKDKKFYQKLIDYPTTNTILRDNISLKKSDETLTLTVHTLNGTRIITWKKSDEPVSTLISDALDRERKDYLQLYRERLYPSHETLALN